MSFAALLTHPLAIVTPVAGLTLDEYGHTDPHSSETVLVNGLVQPRTTREVNAVSQGGAELSTHTIFLPLMRLHASAHIRDASGTTGRRFDITGIRSFEYGSFPHLEVDAKLVGTTEGPSVPGTPEVSGS